MLHGPGQELFPIWRKGEAHARTVELQSGHVGLSLKIPQVDPVTVGSPPVVVGAPRAQGVNGRSGQTIKGGDSGRRHGSNLVWSVRIRDVEDGEIPTRVRNNRQPPAIRGNRSRDSYVSLNEQLLRSIT